MNALTLSFAVGAGGFCGAVARLWVSTAVAKATGEHYAFLGTVTVNLVGCLAIGMLATWTQHTSWFSPAAEKFAITGLLGALTTFSTFSLDAIRLMQDGRMGMALIKIVASVAVGLCCVWLGMKIAHLCISDVAGSGSVHE